MEIIEVLSKKTVNEFHKLPDKIYRNDPNYTPYLRLMIENMVPFFAQVGYGRSPG